jgi:hypothetical protein
MTPQEAYNKGLDVAENEAYQKLSNALQGVNDTPFINPKMEELRLKILQVKKQKPVKVQIIEKKIENISSENMEYTLEIFEDIIFGKKYTKIKEFSQKHNLIIKTFESLMKHFILLASKKHNVGKAFNKILKEHRKMLTSE